MAAKPYGADDVEIVKDAVLFPYILSTLEHDIKIMMNSKMKMGDVYARLLRKSQNDATLAFSEVKKRMRNNGIKLLEEKRESDKFVTTFMCRGYQNEFIMPYRTLKYDVKVRLGKYLDIDFTDKKTDP